MNILITGGSGFLGRKLARALAARGTLLDRAIQRITLFDALTGDPHPIDAARVIQGDIASSADVEAALTPGTDVVFHLAAVVSGQAEEDFDLGMRVNVDGTRALVEACRALGTAPTLVFTSSIAVFGGPLPDPVPDAWPLTPQNSYGAQKAMCELLINDMSRKGYLDGRCVRLPTVTVRPGKANKAASSWASGILREPLNGLPAVCPVAPATRTWVLSPRRAVEALIVAAEAPRSSFAHTRSINVPGLSVSARDMVDALRRVAGDETADRVRWDIDPVVARIVSAWPVAFEAAFGRSLGMTADPDFDSVVRAYMTDELGRAG